MNKNSKALLADFVLLFVFACFGTCFALGLSWMFSVPFWVIMAGLVFGGFIWALFNSSFTNVKKDEIDNDG